MTTTPTFNLIGETYNLFVRSDGENWTQGTYHTYAEVGTEAQQHCLVGGVEQAFFQLLREQEPTFINFAGVEQDLVSVHQVAGDDRMHAPMFLLAQVAVELFPDRLTSLSERRLDGTLEPPTPSATSFAMNEQIVIAFNDNENTSYNDVLDLLHFADQRHRSQLADDNK